MAQRRPFVRQRPPFARGRTAHARRWRDADDLDAQLEDQARRFLRDDSRNRWDAKAGTLHLSKIFDWYAKDFDLPFRGGQSRAHFLAQYATELGVSAAEAPRLEAGEIEIEYLDYDWTLNRSKP